MKLITGLSIALCLWSFSSAGQTDEARGKEAILRWEKEKSNRYIGRPLPDFSATTWDGRKMNNATMLGNVYLLIVFFPDCNCFSPEKLKQLQALEASHKDFHIVPILQDTAYMYIYRQEHAEPLHYAVTDTREQAFALKLDESAPVWVLVDRKGNVAKTLSGRELYEYNKSEEEQAELVKTVQELLLRY